MIPNADAWSFAGFSAGDLIELRSLMNAAGIKELKDLIVEVRYQHDERNRLMREGW